MPIIYVQTSDGGVRKLEGMSQDTVDALLVDLGLTGYSFISKDQFDQIVSNQPPPVFDDNSYPPIQDQLNAIFSGGQDLTDMTQAVIGIKNRPPKLK
jgi:hypothetical protein